VTVKADCEYQRWHMLQNFSGESNGMSVCLAKKKTFHHSFGNNPESASGGTIG